MKRSLLFGGCILIAAVIAMVVRLPELDRRPMHTDEAAHAIKFRDLYQGDGYRYEPYEFHGPTLNYLTLPVVWLSGASDFARTSQWHYRIVPVLFGVGLVVLLLGAGDGLGRTAAVCAGILTAVSPAMAFYSRYYIQEMLLVCFTFGVIVFGWRYARSRSAPWAVAAGVSAGLMHATKETSVIAPAAMLGALAFAAVYLFIPRGLGAGGESPAARASFLRSFDWLGMGLLAGFITVFLFYLSSRPVTGVAPLMDWRLLAGAMVLGATFIWWEGRRSWWAERGRDPFLDLGLRRQGEQDISQVGTPIKRIRIEVQIKIWHALLFII